MATDLSVEKIAGLREGRPRGARRHLNDTIFHLTIGADHHHQGPVAVQLDKFDMLEIAIDLRRDH